MPPPAASASYARPSEPAWILTSGIPTVGRLVVGETNRKQSRSGCTGGEMRAPQGSCGSQAAELFSELSDARAPWLARFWLAMRRNRPISKATGTDRIIQAPSTTNTVPTSRISVTVHRPRGTGPSRGSAPGGQSAKPTRQGVSDVWGLKPRRCGPRLPPSGANVGRRTTTSSAKQIPRPDQRGFNHFTVVESRLAVGKQN